MLTGAHVILYAADAQKARSFFRDTLGWPSVDAGRGWLIFALPPAGVAVHPAGQGDVPSGTHVMYFMCDDLKKTTAALKAKGVEFVGAPSKHSWGILITMKIPGCGEIGLYEPKHPVAAGR